MRKKIILLVFALLAFITFNANINAAKKLVCNYVGSETHGGWSSTGQIIIYINGDFSSVESIVIQESNRETGEEQTYDRTESYGPLFDNYLIQNNERDILCPTSAEMRALGMEFIEHSNQIEEFSSICTNYKYQSSCQDSSSTGQVSCLWNEEYGYCNVDDLRYVSCGDATDIPELVPELISYAITLVKIGAPIILIIIAFITLAKAAASQKEDEIKKAQSGLIKKVIAAVLVFFVINIVQFVILKVADGSEKDSIRSCLSCFLNNECNNAYYKDGYGYCYYVDNKQPFECE